MVCRNKHGFSLIELLVVIAIIAILAAILFPLFLNAKESSKKSVCQNNLKQIGAAIGLYTSDNNDRYPKERASYVPLELTASQVDGASDPQIPGLVYSLRTYVKSPKIWLCPSGAQRSNPSYYIKPRGQSIAGIWPLVTIMYGPGLRKTTCNYWSWSFNRPMPPEQLAGMRLDSDYNAGWNDKTKRLYRETNARGKTPAEYASGYTRSYGAGGADMGVAKVDKIGQLVVEAYWPGSTAVKPFYAHSKGQNVLYYDGRVKWGPDGRSLNE